MILKVDLSNRTFIALRWIDVNPTDPFPLAHCFGSARLRTPRWGQSSRCQAWGTLVGSSMRGSTPDRSHAWIGEAPACFRLALIRRTYRWWVWLSNFLKSRAITEMPPDKSPADLWCRIPIATALNFICDTWIRPPHARLLISILYI